MHKEINIPKYDKGYFPCIIDTQSHFELLYEYIDKKGPDIKKYVLMDKSIVQNNPNIYIRLSNTENCYIYEIVSEETYKSIDKAIEILTDILHKEPSKNDIIINIGGGIVLNLGGFIAGLLLRGIDFIHVPTTLTAQIDVALGGKQAVNFLGYKNQLGFYKDPIFVYVNTNFFK